MSSEEVATSVIALSPVLDECHFPMVRCEYEQPYVKSLSTMLLGLSAATLKCKRGIKLSPGESFIYDEENKVPKEKLPLNQMPQEKLPLYLYEAGVSPKHAKTLNDTHIYVKRASEGTVLVGTLSARQPCIPLELTLGEHCVLTHDSVRRDVFFNGFCITNPEPVTFEAKELWVDEVHPSKEININPLDEGKEYHLLEVYSKKNTNESIDFHFRCKERTLLGKLAGCSRTQLNSVFDDVVSLSHNSHMTSVFFSGYTVPSQPFDFKLKELNEYKEPEELNLKATPKLSLDPEYQSYKERLAKVRSGTPKQKPGANSKQPEVNLITISPLTAPLIFNDRASCQFFYGKSRGLFWAPKQKLEDCNNMVAKTPLKTSASKKKAKIFWGVVVKPGEIEECDPGKSYRHLSLIALETRTEENVEVFVETDDKCDESNEDIPLLIPLDSNTDAAHGADKLTSPRPADAPPFEPKDTVEEPTSPGKPKGDDKGKTVTENQSDGNDSESYEDVDSPRKVEKRPMGTLPKAPQGKKTKIETRSTSNKTGEQACNTGDYVHAATLRSARCASNAPGSKKASKQPTSHTCSSCSRHFSSPMALRDHSKAKHGSADSS
ncbi:uncharacterized protein LOC124660761 isoform X2 [Lolium rigidum]|uniref:uncharacterized protein LOC124660761 isoform X2 n=1 Tax=Lolium rigidum TaxID=89674 RepID=UPI001F5C8DAB|nr:uncharacterized protein LOC124660761 isoform X2 [Lolium rigidum]